MSLHRRRRSFDEDWKEEKQNMAQNDYNNITCDKISMREACL